MRLSKFPTHACCLTGHSSPIDIYSITINMCFNYSFDC